MRQQSYTLNIAQSLLTRRHHGTCVAWQEAKAIDHTEGANTRLRTKKYCHLERSLRASDMHRSESTPTSRRSPATALTSNVGLASATLILQTQHPNLISRRGGWSLIQREPPRSFRLRFAGYFRMASARSQTVIRGHRSRGASSCSMTLECSDHPLTSQDSAANDMLCKWLEDKALHKLHFSPRSRQ